MLDQTCSQAARGEFGSSSVSCGIKQCALRRSTCQYSHPRQLTISLSIPLDCHAVSLSLIVYPDAGGDRRSRAAVTRPACFFCSFRRRRCCCCCCCCRPRSDTHCQPASQPASVHSLAHLLDCSCAACSLVSVLVLSPAPFALAHPSLGPQRRHPCNIDPSRPAYTVGRADWSCGVSSFESPSISPNAGPWPFSFLCCTFKRLRPTWKPFMPLMAASADGALS